ncbi:MAG: hypothetical protein Kow006_09510 [Gammaproteobacteria bacterium]
MDSRTTRKLLVASLLALTLQSCGGGGGTVAGGGIGGTGVISSGSVTGFGSIWQNEVEYETTGAEFEVNDVVVTSNATAGDDQTHFRRGMRIKITGTKSGASGTATRVEYDSDLKGPVSAISNIGDPPAERFRDLTIYGKTVRLDRDNTLFYGTPPITLDDIEVGDVVEISGLFDEAGRLVATFVELTDDLGSNPSAAVELQGPISGLDTGANRFTIGSVTINYSDPPATSFVNVPGGDESGLANGQYVEVKGTHNGVGPAIDATRIEIEDGLFGDNESEVEIEGIVTAFTDRSDFDITIDDNPANTINIDASGATELEPANLFADGLVVAGSRLEVEGPIVGGTLVAREVKLRGNKVKIEAKVEFTGLNSLTFRITPLDTLTVNVDAQTQYRDDFNTPGFGLAQINAGDFLEVRGSWDGNAVTLTEVRRTDRDFSPADGLLDNNGDDVILQGPLDSPATGSGLTILGVSFTYDASVEFKDADDNSISQSEFLDPATNRAGAIVKVKDEQDGVGSGLGDGDADEVEYER